MIRGAPAGRATRVGLIGFGFIGGRIYERICAEPELGLEPVFVHNRDSARLADLPAALRLDALDGFAARGADLVVEVAHPDYTRRWGERILASANYLPVSVTAFADEALYRRLTDQARASGTRLLIPHGALIATDNLVEWRTMWETVEITFRKNPEHIDFSESGVDPASIRGETILYDGSVRGVARRYPRNVNTTMTCALATIGPDRCRARLIAVPGATSASIDVLARGRDGATLQASKVQPMAGVSGTEMIASTLASILRSAGRGPAVDFV